MRGGPDWKKGARSGKIAGGGDRVRGRQLGVAGEVVHESVLGLSFRARAREVRPGGEVVPEVTARSYLMGITQLVVKEDDPFPAGIQL